ncbi:MAG TPA: Flp pilus assembly protein CpaB [Candidatus Limnocylindria bacterium]|nr:Flp pilus assembly protein CpaB [Candidatus Limnocylindria bacterium]
MGVLFAAAAAAGTFFYASSGAGASGGPAATPTTEVLVAAREIPQKTVISATDLRVVKMNTDVVPPSALTAEAQKDLIGKVNVVPIATGELLLLSKFGGSADKVFTVFPPNVVIPAGQAIPPGTPAYRAVSITVPDANAAGGSVQVGDIVDILYTFNFDPSKYFPTTGQTTPQSAAGAPILDFSAKIAIERVPIIARNLSVYTIRTDAQTAERIAYMSAAGATTQLLLRAPQDDRVVNSEGATFGPVYRTFRFPIPQRITP